MTKKLSPKQKEIMRLMKKGVSFHTGNINFRTYCHDYVAHSEIPRSEKINAKFRPSTIQALQAKNLVEIKKYSYSGVTDWKLTRAGKRLKMKDVS